MPIDFFCKDSIIAIRILLTAGENYGRNRKESYEIIIVGCGKVGTSLAERLSQEGHDLVLVDLSAEKIDDVSSRFDAMGIVGNGASFTVQTEAGVEDADLLSQ